MTLPKRRMIVSNLRLTEISSVDRPAQEGAIAVLLKNQSSGDDDVAIRKNAAAVSETDAAPGYGVADFEDAMFRRAEELADKRGITPEKALFVGLSSDKIMKDLAHAGEVARAAAYADQVRKRGTALAS